MCASWTPGYEIGVVNATDAYTCYNHAHTVELFSTGKIKDFINDRFVVTRIQYEVLSHESRSTPPGFLNFLDVPERSRTNGRIMNNNNNNNKDDLDSTAFADSLLPSDANVSTPPEAGKRVPVV